MEEFPAPPEAIPDDEPVLMEEEVAQVEKPPRDFEVAPVKVVSEVKPGWGRLLLIGLLSAILGAAAALVILYGLNGTLDFQSASSRALRAEAYRLDGELGTLGSRVDQLEAQLAAMQDLAPAIEEAQSDIQGLRGDLDAAESTLGSVVEDLTSVQASLNDLDDSVAGLEEQMGSVTDDIESVQAQVGELGDQIASMDEELQSLSKAAERFGAFLDGLRDLLSESGTTSVPTRTPLATVTQEPEVTVIPLATPTPTQ
jgi:prefoldin subunit 5